MGSFYLTCLLFVFVVLNIIARLTGFSLVKLLRYIAHELWLVLGTSSSESALPTLMAKLEHMARARTSWASWSRPATRSTLTALPFI